MQIVSKLVLVSIVALAGCVPPAGEEHSHSHDFTVVKQQIVDCSERQDTGYTRGNPPPITGVTVDGKPVERDTAKIVHGKSSLAAGGGMSSRALRRSANNCSPSRIMAMTARGVMVAPVNWSKTPSSFLTVH